MEHNYINEIKTIELKAIHTKILNVLELILL